jgi:hypothetical protein
MVDTKQPHGPTEGDGVNYRGIVWFVVILAIVTVTCQIIIWVLLRAMQHQDAGAQAARVSPLAPAVQPADRQAVEGRVYPEMAGIGLPNGPAPRLLVDEPANLEAMRARERQALTTYGLADEAAGTYRIPIERAKALLIERGLPVRGQQP